MFRNVGNKESVTRKIEIQLENAIRQKKFVPGDKLPSQEDLCESFGVGRNVLREAIRSLVSRGLITVIKGSGMYVTQLSMNDAASSMNYFLELRSDKDSLYQIIKLRQMFEPHIAAAACLNITEATLAQLGQTIVDLERCQEGDLKTESEIDNRFHSLLAEGSGNFAVSLIMRPIYNILPKYHTILFGKVPGLRKLTLQYHRDIFSAIREKDSDRAKRLMENHLQETEKNFLQFFDQA